MTTANDLIDRSLRTIGVLASGESPDADMSQDSLSALNDMLDSWNASRLYLYQTVTNTISATLNDGTYTIGPTGNINTTRPTNISNVTYTISANDYLLKRINRDEYAAIFTKNDGGIPEYYYYEPSSPLGVIYLWPVPATAGTISVQSPQQLTEFATLTTDITLPPGYRQAIHLGLSVALCNEFSMELPVRLKDAEMVAKRRIRRLNVTVPVLNLPCEVMNFSGGYPSYL